MKRNRRERGITLVTLIITIIILVILAVVGITAITEQNMLFQVSEAVEAWKNSEGVQENMMKNSSSIINNYLPNNQDSNLDSNVDPDPGTESICKHEETYDAGDGLTYCKDCGEQVGQWHGDSWFETCEHGIQVGAGLDCYYCNNW